mmetsp:Transcript_16761/g.20295  ORF Transcript_16761/g.20295 Transcript_16761/m.20295 type:complete len:1030 (+) Transcript_16761:64-3153(+)
MKTVEQVLSEPSPATVNYRINNTRSTLQELIDSGTSQAGLRRSSSDRTPKDSSKVDNSSTKLNWKNGVLVPCLLNIWGVIMFLRLGWVVGQAGVWLGSLIIIFSNLVTTITALSMCAICTNGEVKGGGVYFLISRALGPVFGGCIGILFFVAQAVATSLYIVGFGESIVDLMDSLGVDPFTGSVLNDIRVIGIGTAIVLLLVALNGIGWYAKCQIGLLIVLVIAMIAVFIGAFLPDLPSAEDNQLAGFVGFGWRNFHANFQTDPQIPEVEQDFFKVFAVFFPAVTGIMAGANLSGDLDDPSHAIPKGTLTAIAMTFVSYMALLWFIGLTCEDCVGVYCPEGGATQEEIEDLIDNGTLPTGGLLYNKLIMKDVALWAPLVYIGVFAATLSSALASLVGAPRILQSVAGDQLFPWQCLHYFAQGVGVGNEPFRAYFLTFFITCACVSIGKLDIIAPLISNFFMISYAMTNYACFAASSSKATGWRPSFRYYNKWLSGFGAVLCIVVMFFIEWVTALVTCILCFAIFRYLTYIDPAVNWGEAGEAKKYVNALQTMETLQLTNKEHVKTFRPQFLVLTGPLEERAWLVKFVSLLQKGRGLMICADIIVGNEARGTAKSFYKDSSGNDGADLALTDVVDDSSGLTSLSVSSDDKHHEKAIDLATDYEMALARRRKGDDFLTNQSIWARKCPGAFCEVIVASSIFDGVQTLLQTSGLGRMRPNTVVMGFKHDWRDDSVEEVANYERTIRASLSAHLGLMIVRDDNAKFDLNMKSALSVKSRHGDENDQGCLSCITCCKDGGNTEAKTDTVKVQVHNSVSETLENGHSENGDKLASKLKRRGTHHENPVSSRLEIERSLPTSLSGNRIDVWWLSDDGGLTMLLPHLLVQNQRFKSHNLRVMAVVQSQDESSVKLHRVQVKMAHLLAKFRIKAETIGVEVNMNTKASDKTVNRFESLGIKMEDLNAEEVAKTNFQLRLSEVVREQSSDASCVFIVLPIPETGLRVRLYCSWLDMLSNDMPPMVMMRGNNEQVLTFFS